MDQKWKCVDLKETEGVYVYCTVKIGVFVVGVLILALQSPK